MQGDLVRMRHALRRFQLAKLELEFSWRCFECENESDVHFWIGGIGRCWHVEHQVQGRQGIGRCWHVEQNKKIPVMIIIFVFMRSELPIMRSELFVFMRSKGYHLCFVRFHFQQPSSMMFFINDCFQPLGGV